MYDNKTTVKSNLFPLNVLSLKIFTSLINLLIKKNQFHLSKIIREAFILPLKKISPQTLYVAYFMKLYHLTKK